MHEINDIAFVGVEHPELGPGYDLWVGGGLSTNPRLAERLGVFVAAEEVADVWPGVVSIFRDYGYRRLRNKARLKFLLADWGPEKFREVLEDGVPRLRRCPTAPAPETPTDDRGDHVGVHEQKDGRFYVGVAPDRRAGVSGALLLELADLLEAHGSTAAAHHPAPEAAGPRRRRRTASTRWSRGLDALGWRPRRRSSAAHTMACTGIEFCKLAIVDTKDTATRTRSPSSRSGSPTSSTRSTCRCRLHVNGCPNSCARIQVADIGLKGQIVTDGDGDQVDGLPGPPRRRTGLDRRDEAGFGRKVRGLKVTAERAAGLRRAGACASFVGRPRAEGERFAEWAHRARTRSCWYDARRSA